MVLVGFLQVPLRQAGAKVLLFIQDVRKMIRSVVDLLLFNALAETHLDGDLKL